MTHGYFEGLTIRTAPYKKLCYKAFNIAKNPKYDGDTWTLFNGLYIF